MWRRGFGLILVIILFIVGISMFRQMSAGGATSVLMMPTVADRIVMQQKKKGQSAANIKEVAGGTQVATFSTEESRSTTLGAKGTAIVATTSSGSAPTSSPVLAPVTAATTSRTNPSTSTAVVASSSNAVIANPPSFTTSTQGDNTVAGTGTTAVMMKSGDVADGRSSLATKLVVTVPFTIARNSPSGCGNIVPNETAIDPYKGCPLPGLNNLLYSQTNRWYCTATSSKAGFMANLRDRSCDKGTVTPFRFSTIVTIDYEKAKEQGFKGTLCWSDIKKQTEPPGCGWDQIPKFYGRPNWWKARALFDFHSEYYAAAQQYIQYHFNNEPFIAVHLRRGDYFTHCVSVRRKRTPAWVTFDTSQIESLADRNPARSGKKKKDHNGNVHAVHSNCYPTLEEIVEHFKSIRNATGIKHIFLATNLPEEFADLAASLNIHTFTPRAYPTIGGGEQASEGGKKKSFGFELRTTRKMDAMIVEMCVAALGSFYVFNRYSSFSGSIFEMAKIHGRTKQKADRKSRYSNVVTW